MVKATRTAIWAAEWDEGDQFTFNPVLISCVLPQDLKPNFIKMNAQPCAATKILSVYFPKKAKIKDYLVTVCVKPLNFAKDISKRLMEWIEINKILGAHRIEVFVKKVHKNVKRILEFYSNHRKDLSVELYEDVEDYLGDLVFYGDASAVSGDELSKRKVWQKRRNELITYNDCLYRNLHSSHFIIPLDIDEIIVPKTYYTWKETLSYLFNSRPNLQEEYASFSVRNAYFLEEFTRTPRKGPAFFFEYFIRSGFSDEGESGKSFVSTANTLTVFNHYAFEALRPGVRRTYFVPESVFQMNHYKKTCSVVMLPQCFKYLSSPIRINDNVIDKYKNRFVANYKRALSKFRRKRLINL